MSCESLDAELVALHFLLTWIIVALPRLARRDGNLVTYEFLVTNKVSIAPSAHWLSLFRFIFHTLAAVASVIVRIDGGAYTKDGNRLMLIEYWVVQVLVALHFHMFFNCSRRFTSLVPLAVALVVCFVDAHLFYKLDQVAGLLLYTFFAWLIYLFILGLVTASKNSDPDVQRAIVALYTNRKKQKSSVV